MRRVTNLPTLIAAMSALGLAVPATAPAATCPPGQTGTPPYCQSAPTQPTPTPVAVVTTENEASGAVEVTLSLPGSGMVKLRGKAIKPISARAGGGDLIVTLKPTGKVRRHLINKGWTRRKRITATFTATDGSTQTITIVVRFRKQ